MPTTNNKVKYGIKNVYYAVATIAAGNTATYDTPVAIPGAVSLSLEQQGENEPFYADNIVYYTSIGNSGYEGDLEVALLPDSFRKDVLGEVLDGKNVLFEDVDAPPVHFALLFQFEGDVKATKHVLYNCTCTRPALSSSTKEDSVTPQTESITIKATSIKNATLNKEVVKAKANEDSDATVYAGWTSSVYMATSTT